MSKELLPLPIMSTSNDAFTARLRVDVGQTGFFEGREFRTFYEYSVPSGQSVYIRATVPINIILFSTGLTLDGGRVRMSLSVGGTESGSWSPIPVIPKNTMSDKPDYTPQVQVHIGGTHAGGTVIDVVRLLSESTGNRANTVGGQLSDERGVGAGVYYYRIQNVDGQTANGVFSAFWEERP